MKNVLFLLLAFFLVFSVSCNSNDDDDSIDDDAVDDDSADDDVTDDDVIDDDITDDDDDDDNDDVTPDDDNDSTDDDTVDDDTIDDDTVDDDTADDDFLGDDDTVPDTEPLTINGTLQEILAEGHAEVFGLAPGPDEQHNVLAVINRRLKVLTDDGENTVQTIVSPFGLYAAMTADADRALHVCFYDQTTGELKYATNKTGVWQTETLTTGNVTETAIAVAPDGAVYVFYSYYTDDKGKFLALADNAGGGWQITEPAVFILDGVYDLNILVDTEGAVHLAYYTIWPFQAPYTVYMTNESGAWETEPLPALYLASNQALMQDDAGNMHLLVELGQNLVLRTRQNGEWSTNVVLRKSNLINACLLQGGDGALQVFFSYGKSRSNEYNLARAVQNGDEWIEEIIDTGASSALFYAIKADGAEAVAYQRVDAKALMLARHEVDCWAMRELHHSNIAGLVTAPVAENDGDVHLLFWNGGTEDASFLWHFRQEAGVWHKSALLREAPFSLGYALALDSAEQPHVAYCNPEDGAIHYLKRGPDGWTSRILPDAPTCGSFMALGIDAQGKAHIAYLSYYDETLHYADNVSGTWSYQDITTAPVIMGPLDMVVEADGDTTVSWQVVMPPLLYLGENKSGEWKKTILPIPVATGTYNFLDLDLAPNGELGLAVYAYPIDYLYLSVRNGLVWSDIWHTWDVNIYAYGFSYDGAGNRHIAYMTEDFPGVFRYVSDESGDFVDTIFDAGYWLPTHTGEGSLRLIATSDDLVHALYHADGALCHTTFPQGYTGP